MPLIKEIENTLPFVAELPEYFQKEIARQMATWVLRHEESQTLTPKQQRAHLELRLRDMQRRWRDL